MPNKLILKIIPAKIGDLEKSKRAENLFYEEDWIRNMCKISELYPKDWKKIFNTKQSLIIKDSSNRNCCIWAIEYEKIKMFIVSAARGRGTTIEFLGIKDKKVIGNFLKEVINILDSNFID